MLNIKIRDSFSSTTFARITFHSDKYLTKCNRATLRMNIIIIIIKTYLYGGVLLSTPLHASSNFTVSVQLANKRGFKQK
jgi:hypothetical protein